ncbi:MAG: S53 family peptidase [Tepidisphaeraceae bacterium]
MSALGGPLFEGLENRTLLSASQLLADPSLAAVPDASASSIAGYTPAQIRAAYGFNAVTLSNGAAGTGAGQTIAIVDAYNDPNISGDLAAFDSQYRLGAASLKVVSQTGSTTALPAANAGWDLEISLDVEWAHAIAPGANILLVEASSSSLGNLLTAVNYARNAAGVSVVSMSWGASEFSSETQYDGYFTTPSGHQGVTFVSASGDEGSWYGPEWPASSPNVLSVGGTTLNLANSSGTWGSETGWSDSTGGISSYEREPSYQTIAQTTGARTTPDVAYDANPNTGLAVYDSVAYDGGKGWWEVGGTSAGAPQWAALVAIADQGRAVKGLGTLNGTSQTLPLLYSLYNSTQYSQAFHDETVGASSWFFSAGPGYDAVTGLGSPRAPYVIQELIGAGPTVTVTAAKVSTAAAVKTSSSRAGVHPRFTVDQNGGAPYAAAGARALSTSAGSQSSDVAAASGRQAVELPTLWGQAGGDSAAFVSIKTAWEPGFELAGSFLSGTWRGAFADFSTTLAVSNVDAEIAAAAGFFRGFNGVSTAGPSAQFVEKLVISDATALAQVANTLAVRLYEQNAMAWKEFAGLLGAAMIVGMHAARGRPASGVPARKRKNQKFLCVGERGAGAMEPEI